MTELQKEIDQAFKLVSAIQVSGDAVDVMAMVRGHLRAAYGSRRGGGGNRGAAWNRGAV